MLISRYKAHYNLKVGCFSTGKVRIFSLKIYRLYRRLDWKTCFSFGYKQIFWKVCLNFSWSIEKFPHSWHSMSLVIEELVLEESFKEEEWNFELELRTRSSDLLATLFIKFKLGWFWYFAKWWSELIKQSSIHMLAKKVAKNEIEISR